MKWLQRFLRELFVMKCWSHIHPHRRMPGNAGEIKMSVKQRTSFSHDVQPPCRAVCLLCKSLGIYKTIPFTNPRGVCAAMRRHRDKCHPLYKGKNFLQGGEGRCTEKMT